jgi:predicted secreted Zn-dependent protease
MTDFRALCAELHAAFNTYAVDMKHHDLLERARAALTEPKPPSLKEQALTALRQVGNCEEIDNATFDTIRRALEALPE